MAKMNVSTTKVGGFHATFVSGQSGDTYEFHASELIRRADVAWRQVVVAGEIEMTQVPQGASAWPVQRAGGDDRELPDIVPGNYVRRANENGTLFVVACAMTSDGEPLPFESEILHLEAGKTFVLPQGHVLVLGRGRIEAAGRLVEGPIPVLAQSGDVEFTCVDGPVIGVHAWR